jgi:DNA-binding NtrC family response regulator
MRRDFVFPQTTPTLDPEIACRVADLLNEGKGDIYRVVIQSVEKELFRTVLAHFKGNRVKASRALGISRFTLRKKLRALAPQAEDLEGQAESVQGQAELAETLCHATS